MLAAAACSPAAPPAPAPTPVASATETAAPAAAPAAATGAISLAGTWTGAITCYKIESPLLMKIDAAKPGEASVSKGQGGALSWKAKVTVDEAKRIVTVLADGAADGAERIEGQLSEDGALISGTMTRQLCTVFALRRAS
jgi:hypothetical protein